MDGCIASYECRVSGWDWVYELFPDKLLVRGVMGKESQYFETELQHCSDTPDRGVTTVEVLLIHARFWIVYGIMVGFTALFFGSVIVVTTLLNIPLPGNHKGVELVPFTVSLLFLELVAVPLLARVLRKRRFQRYVTFKRVSDGGALLTLNSALDPDDTFEDFVAQVVAAIRSRRRPDPPPNYSIQR
jgi:hypothetical protein